MISQNYRLELTFFLTSVAIYAVNAGQTCLSCKGIPEPTECSFVTECGSHEQCYVQKYVNAAGHLMYDLGCADHYVCGEFPRNRQLQRVLGKQNAIVCEACCNSTKICNNRNLCGSQVLPDSSGTICYACDYQTHPESCDQITLCSIDRACCIGMSRDETTMLYHYVTGCALKETKCRTLEQYPDNPYCSRCCEGDLCNDRCHSSLTNDKLCLDRNPFCPLLQDKCHTVSEVRLACPGTCSLCQEHNLSTPHTYNVTTGYQNHTLTTKSTSLSYAVSLTTSPFLTTTKTSTTRSTTTSFPSSTPSSTSSSSSSSSSTATTSTTSTTTSSSPISFASNSPTIQSSVTAGQHNTDSARNSTVSSLQTDRTVHTNNLTTFSTTASFPTTSDACIDAKNIDCKHYDLFKICNQTSIYYGFAQTHCPLTCGICHPVGCKDTIPNCDEYEDGFCTNHEYTNFVFLACKRYCNRC
uniref:ShKT domain-containing protein n=1 Tax=Magallana gigas TaxID=29159 RepID=A0A8W8NX91_MAGGI|nr:A-agglutinin anchorage subunit-like isoform X1 [Crassostrea gigas]